MRQLTSGRQGTGRRIVALGVELTLALGVALTLVLCASMSLAASADAAQPADSGLSRAEHAALQAYTRAVRPLLVKVLLLVRETGEQLAVRMQWLSEMGIEEGMEPFLDAVLLESEKKYRLAVFNLIMARLSSLPVPPSAQSAHEAVLDGMRKARLVLEHRVTDEAGAESAEEVEGAGRASAQRAAQDAMQDAVSDVQTTFQRASSSLAQELAREVIQHVEISQESIASSSTSGSSLVSRLASDGALTRGGSPATVEVPTDGAASPEGRREIEGGSGDSTGSKE